MSKPDIPSKTTENQESSKVELITYRKESKKGEDVLSKEKEKNIFENVFAETFGQLKESVQELALTSGFKLSQNTGLKTKKYAYFYCSLSHKNKKNNKEEDQTLSKTFINISINLFFRFSLSF